MIRILLIVSAVLLGLSGAYLAGHVAGANSVKAGQLGKAVKALGDAAKDVKKVQATVDRLKSAETDLATAVGNVRALAPEIDKRLKDAKVLAGCPPFTAGDVRVLNTTLDRIDAEAGLAPRRSLPEPP